MRSSLKRLTYFVLGIFFVFILLLSGCIKNLPETDLWHTEVLESEFDAKSSVKTFPAYLALENDLFSELNKKIIEKVSSPDQKTLNRFCKGSLSNPESGPKNWNRTFVLETESPKAGVLLLHGMSDSPYSLRNLGQRLNREGAFVVGLRLPGHGTGPSGLLNIKWEEMAEAVEIAIKYIADKTGEAPLYVVGYSNGGALGLQYALRALEDSSCETLSGLILISPAIGVSKIAVLAKWQESFSKFPGFEKLAWTNILPEYDPYKYNSFTANAGNQVYRLTKEIRRLLALSAKRNTLENLPRILAFQSIVDATVSTKALLDGLFRKLPKTGHELVVFDINRTFMLKPLILNDPVPEIHQLLERRDLDFTLSLLTNKNDGDRHLFLHQNHINTAQKTITPLDLIWPKELHSLSHISLPFPKSDPVYGGLNTRDVGPNWGNIALRGERGLLRVPAATLLRLRWNPFYSYMEDNICKMIFLDTFLTNNEDE